MSPKDVKGDHSNAW